MYSVSQAFSSSGAGVGWVSTAIEASAGVSRGGCVGGGALSAIVERDFRVGRGDGRKQGLQARDTLSSKADSVSLTYTYDLFVEGRSGIVIRSQPFFPGVSNPLQSRRSRRRIVRTFYLNYVTASLLPKCLTPLPTTCIQPTVV